MGIAAAAYSFELRLRGEALVLVHGPLRLDAVLSLRRRLAPLPLVLRRRRRQTSLVDLLPPARRFVEHQRPAASNQHAASGADRLNAPRRVPVPVVRRGTVRPVPAQVLAFPLGEEEPPALAVVPVLRCRQFANHTRRY